jgi:hypothetical protein
MRQREFLELIGGSARSPVAIAIARGRNGRRRPRRHANDQGSAIARLPLIHLLDRLSAFASLRLDGQSELVRPHEPALLAEAGLA